MDCQKSTGQRRQCLDHEMIPGDQMCEKNAQQNLVSGHRDAPCRVGRHSPGDQPTKENHHTRRIQPGLFAVFYADSEAYATGILDSTEVKNVGATPGEYDFSKKFLPAWPGAEHGELFVRVYFRRELREDGTIGHWSKSFNFEIFFQRNKHSRRLQFLMQSSKDLVIEAQAIPVQILYSESIIRGVDPRGFLNRWKTAMVPDQTPIEKTNIREEYLLTLREECKNHLEQFHKELAQLKKAQEEVQERRKALHQSWLTLKE
ncbi:unnamed protein product [Caenorhabditis brenneri]